MKIFMYVCMCVCALCEMRMQPFALRASCSLADRNTPQPKSSTLNPPSTINPKPLTLNPQPSTLNPKP